MLENSMLTTIGNFYSDSAAQLLVNIVKNY